MKVKDCMCKNVYFVNQDTLIYDAVNIMEKNGIGSLPICDNNKNICGIITDRDILLKTVSYKKDLNKDTIKSIMCSNVCTCNEKDDINKAKDIMKEYKIRRVPVIDNQDNIVGIITINDIAEAAKTNICNCNNVNDITKEAIFDTIDNICNCN